VVGLRREFGFMAGRLLLLLGLVHLLSSSGW
jgi:hypothetical protein